MSNKKKNKRKSGNGKKVSENREKQDSTTNQDDTTNLTATTTSSSTLASVTGSDSAHNDTSSLHPVSYASTTVDTLSEPDQNLQKIHSMSTKCSDPEPLTKGAQSLYTDAKSWVETSPSTSRTSINLDEGYLTALDTPTDSQSNQNFSNQNHQLEEGQDELSLQALDQHLSTLLSDQDQQSNMNINQNLTLLDAVNPNPLASKLEVGSLGLTDSYSKNASGLNLSSDVFSPRIPSSSLPEQSDTIDASKENRVTEPSVDLNSESVKDLKQEKLSKGTDDDTPEQKTDHDHDHQSDMESNEKHYVESLSEQSIGIESQTSLIDPIRGHPINSPTSIKSDLIDGSSQITPTVGHPNGFEGQLDRKVSEFKEEAHPDAQNNPEVQAVDQHQAELRADHDDANATVPSIRKDTYYVEKKPLASDVESTLQYTDEEVPTSLDSSSDHMVSLDAIPTTNTVLTSSSGCTNDDTFMTSKSHSRPDFVTAVLSSSRTSSEVGAALTEPQEDQTTESQSLAIKSLPSGTDEELNPVVDQNLNQERISSLFDASLGDYATSDPSDANVDHDLLSQPLDNGVGNYSAEVETTPVPSPAVDATELATEHLSLPKPIEEGIQPSTLDAQDIVFVETHQFGSDTGLVKMILDDTSSQTITPQSVQPAISSMISTTSGPDSQDPNVAPEEKVMGHTTSSQIELADDIPKEPTPVTTELMTSPAPPVADITAKEPTIITAELINPSTPPPTNDGPNESTTSATLPQTDTTPLDGNSSQPVNDTQSKELPAASVNRSISMSKTFFKSLNSRKESNKTPDKSKTLKPSSTIAGEIIEEKASIVTSTLKKKRSLSGLKQKALNSWNARHSNQLHLKEPLPDLSKIQDVVNSQNSEVSSSSPEQVDERQEPQPPPPAQDQESVAVEQKLDENDENDECKGEEAITRVVSRNTETQSNTHSGLSPLKLFKRTMLNKKNESPSKQSSTRSQPTSPPQTEPTWRLVNNNFTKGKNTNTTTTATSSATATKELNSGGIGYSPNLSQCLKKQPNRSKTLNETSEKKVGSKDHYRFGGILSKIFR